MVDENDIYQRLAKNYGAIYTLERQVAGLLELVAELSARLSILETVGPENAEKSGEAEDFEEVVKEIIREHGIRKIDAVKAVRSRFRIQLIDAKRLVDAYWKE